MDRKRPVIGISAYDVPVDFGQWKEFRSVLVPQGYVRAVVAAGGIPVLIPPTEVATAILGDVDGMVFTGGSDINPAVYGQEPHPESSAFYDHRDAAELEVMRAALSSTMPVLGICRGMQLINVALGGTLVQHLPDDVGHTDHRRALGSFDNADHDVRLAAGSLAARACGEIRHATKSHHHQAVASLGEGVVASGWSVLDELVEAIELPEARWALGVQWHPEVDPRSRVVRAFAAEAARTPAHA